jgi:radical SAM superfamily enzyme YgiQ (UPF0313 family)
MRILLIPPKSNYPSPLPYGGIIGQAMPYLAAACKAAGHEVAGLNLCSEWCHGSAPLHLEKALRHAIEAGQPQAIGLSGLSADYLFVRDALSFIRQFAPHTPIILGGGILSYDPDFIFNTLQPDFGVIGDGEETLILLLEALQGKAELAAVPNLVYRKDGTQRRTARKQMSANLDALPFPDYAPFDFQTHLRMANQTDHHFYTHTRQQPRILPVSMGRSCPFKCTFCCHLGGETYRQRSVEGALREIAHFYEMYQFNILFIYDELFSMNSARVEAFCDGIRELREREHMDFDWTCDLRVERPDLRILRKMKAAGCYYIGYGFESGSDTILKSMKKGTTVAQIERAIDLTLEAGMGAQGALLFGDPAETKETLAETAEFYRKHAHHAMIGYGYVTPYPGSELFAQCLAKGLIQDKLAYYEKVTVFTEKQINMTTLPTEVFGNLTDAARQSAGEPLPSVPVREYQQTGECLIDREAPLTLRRTNYRLQVQCPHCTSLVDFVLPLRKRQEGSGQQEVYCPECHHRFILIYQHDQLIEPAVPKILFRYFYGDPAASYVYPRPPR